MSNLTFATLRLKSVLIAMAMCAVQGLPSSSAQQPLSPESSDNFRVERAYRYAQRRTPEWLREGFSRTVSQRRDNAEMMQLVRPVTESVKQSVVEVLSAGTPVCLGTVASADGYVLTKRSELSGDPIRVRFDDGRVLAARVAAVRRENDLALLKVETKSDLQAVEFHQDLPAVGSFVITAGRTGRPIGIGSMSAPSRKVDHNGRLGVVLGQDIDGRARVDGVWPASGAAIAGIVPKDQIIAINGREVFSSDTVIATLRKMFPGESVQLTILREGNKMEMNAGIRDLGVMQESENDSRVNGPRSARLSGFDRVFQHDTVLNPNQCGGPVVDSSGRVIGMNIARAGRVVSYALPSELLLPEMLSMLQEARSAASEDFPQR